MSDVQARPIWRHPEFAHGARDMVGISMGIAAWGLVTGVAMAKSGLPLPLAVLMSLLVFAGSAQLAALPLIITGAPVWMVWAIALCVNLRFVIFSAQWRPYFAHLPRWQRMRLGYFTADLNYVVFMSRFPQPRPSPEQLPYFWGGVAVNWLSWQLPTLAGLLLADAIPTEWGFGFAGILALLALMYSLLSDRASWVAAGVAFSAAVATAGLPLKLNIVVAIAAAVAAGLLMDHVTPIVVKPVEDRT
ncbi:MAG: AzlC family ABC transporter permease [Burkholderiales bacterium]|nr:AzlC family ABC transporter permease [Burkholderiales bacterium]MDE2626147.1 AzlC family ABC transporter permease [Burkholderiales bacterium]